MSNLVSLEKVKEWLITGTDKPESFVDLKWNVISEKRINDKLVSFTVTHESIPISLLVMDLEAFNSSVKAIRLVIETGVETVDLDPNDKLRLYRKLLEASKIPFISFYLYGEEDTIGVAVDIDKRGLTKDEFEAHMATLFMGYAVLLEIKTIEEELLKSQLGNLLSLVASWIKSGMGRDQAIARLVSGGLDRDIAERIVDSILAMHSESHKSKKNSDSLWI